MVKGLLETPSSAALSNDRLPAPPMRICIVTPTDAQRRRGNWVTAARWRRILRELGHRVIVRQRYDDEPCDLLIALHARRSYPSMARFRHLHPDAPLVLALTGTDLYGDMRVGTRARRAVQWASRLIVLHPLAVGALPRGMRKKARLIYQSVERPHGTPKKARGKRQEAKGSLSCLLPLASCLPLNALQSFDVCVLGHLRAVKDPFRAAMAVRNLPAASRLRIVHIGDALDARMAERARRENDRNPRYRWLGGQTRATALRRLAGCRLMVLSSRSEGGANAIGEAATLGVPIIASRIDGNVGLLGRDHPGLYRVGDTNALRKLLLQAESDATFYRDLLEASRRIAPLFSPALETRTWRSLLAEL